MKKKLVGVLILLIVVTGVFYFARNDNQKLKPLPTKDNPSPSGLYADIPPFEEWGWKEEKDEEGNVVYRIKFPPKETYVSGVYIPGRNNILIIAFPNEGQNYSNISDYYKENKENVFIGKFWSSLGDSNLGKYYTHKIVDSGPTYEISDHYILTKENIVIIGFDFVNDCNKVSIKEENINICREYFQIYLPIVEKALSTLEIPDYLDDRGLAPEELREIKLLPDELRVYEVR